MPKVLPDKMAAGGPAAADGLGLVICTWGFVVLRAGVYTRRQISWVPFFFFFFFCIPRTPTASSDV